MVGAYIWGYNTNFKISLYFQLLIPKAAYCSPYPLLMWHSATITITTLIILTNKMQLCFVITGRVNKPFIVHAFYCLYELWKFSWMQIRDKDLHVKAFQKNLVVLWPHFFVIAPSIQLSFICNVQLLTRQVPMKLQISN